MGILTSQKIRSNINCGLITIEPFNDSQLNPNSYNVRLHDEIYIYRNNNLDMKNNNETYKKQIPKEGFILEPGTIYLGRTVEKTYTDRYIPMIEGRSSGARLGLFVHSCGFGDIGFNGYWTLELSVVQPLVIYPFVEIAQLYYVAPSGVIDRLYKGKYQGNNDTQSSKLYEEFKDLKYEVKKEYRGFEEHCKEN